MTWKDKKVFVTGADGFIGAWLVKKLQEFNADVYILIRDFKKVAAYRLFGLEGKVTQINGDLLDYRLLERVISEYSIDTCFHLGAQALVQVANNSPLSTFESNIEGTWNILEACRNSASLERVVVASSDKCYGNQKKLPYTEETSLQGLYPYDASKACADILARSYFASYGLPVAVSRNANTYGGGDLNFSRIIPDAICCLLEDREFIIRSDGSLQRDYMYIEDAVEAYLSLARNIGRKGVNGEAFNFGTEKPISVLELFKLISRLCGKKNAKVKILGQAKNEIGNQYLAINKAKNVLKWRPKFSLEQGLEQAIKWYKLYLKQRAVK